MGKNILITATAPRCDDYVSDLHAQNIPATANPALIVRSLNIPKPDGEFDAVLITSHHAKRDDFPDLPVIEIAMGEGGIQDLDLSGYKNILYPCASEPTFIPDNCTPWPVYETSPNPNFNINEEEDIICVFSVKGARVVARHDLSHKTVLCLSTAIATIFKTKQTQKLAVSTSPRYDSMISLILNEIKAHT